MIKTGKAPISLMTYLAIMSINLIVNLPGIAVSPMEGRLKEILGAPELEVQLLTTLPNFLIIPFVLLSGKLSLARHKIPIIVSGLILYSACAIAYLFAKSMLALVIISCLLGCGAGLLIPFAAGLIADCFTGKYRMKQMGWKSGISNSSVVLATFLVGWLIEFPDWHIPFVVYLVALIPLVFSLWLKKVPGLAYEPQGAAKPAAVQPQPATASSGSTNTVSAGTAQNSTSASNAQASPSQQPSADIDGAPLTPFTEEIITDTASIDIKEKKGKASAEIKVTETQKEVLKPENLAEEAVEIAEEASELSLDALRLARGEKISQADIDDLTRRAQAIANLEANAVETAPKPANPGKPATPATQTNTAATQEKPVASEKVINKEFYAGKIWALIGVYFFVTFTAIAIANYCTQLVADYNWKSTIAGDVTAVFFLFVLLPGYCLPFFVRILRGSTFFWTAIMLMVGLGLFVFIKAPWSMFVGSALVGLGYGICQPVLYDKASYTVTNPAKATLALAFVLTANYLAIAVEPFVISGVANLIHSDNPNMFAFEFSLGLVIAYTIISLFLRKKFAFSVDKTYYS